MNAIQSACHQLTHKSTKGVPSFISSQNNFIEESHNLLRSKGVCLHFLHLGSPAPCAFVASMHSWLCQHGFKQVVNYRIKKIIIGHKVDPLWKCIPIFQRLAKTVLPICIGCYCMYMVLKNVRLSFDAM